MVEGQRSVKSTAGLPVGVIGSGVRVHYPASSSGRVACWLADPQGMKGRGVEVGQPLAGRGRGFRGQSSPLPKPGGLQARGGGGGLKVEGQRSVNSTAGLPVGVKGSEVGVHSFPSQVARRTAGVERWRGRGRTAPSRSYGPSAGRGQGFQRSLGYRQAIPGSSARGQRSRTPPAVRRSKIATGRFSAGVRASVFLRLGAESGWVPQISPTFPPSIGRQDGVKGHTGPPLRARPGRSSMQADSSQGGQRSAGLDFLPGVKGHKTRSRRPATRPRAEPVGVKGRPRASGVKGRLEPRQQGRG